MKIVGIFAALALAVAPMMASAQSTSSSSDNQQAASPEPGGISQTGGIVLPVLGTIPAGAVVVGSIVILGGIAIGVVASDDSTTSTTN